MSDTAQQAQKALANLRTLLPDLETVYKDIHSHPELSMQETRTAGLAADRLRAAGYEVTAGIGKTGVAGILRNARESDDLEDHVREALGLTEAEVASLMWDASASGPASRSRDTSGR